MTGVVVQVRAVVRGGKALRRELTLIDRRVDRATMWTVREGGRQVKRQARRTAPVLRTGQQGALSRRQVKAGPLVVNRNRPVAGLYKASITSGKRLQHPAPGAWGVRVAPRGPRVHLYAGKVEQRHQVMANAKSTVQPQFRAIAQLAWTRATRR